MADMATTDARFGLIPWGPMKDDSCHYYAIETEPDVDLFHGDPAETEGTAVTTPHMGPLQSIEVKVGGAEGSLVGVIMALFDEDMCPVTYIATTDAGNGTIAGYALVCDDPFQRYIVQEDGVGSSIVAADFGLSGDLVLTHGGDTTTGVSGCELDSSDTHAPGGATGDVRVLGIHPEDSISAAGAAGNHARFIVQLNSAYRDVNIAGV
ncbi:MAG: hypothetical protein EHM49_00805 [Deltaproteobacteria bacterium]|nr:MAG: hypothetical protein EHM49_00805 [Deltaproteobacteria bacterium]